MADNVTTQSAVPATLPNNTGLAARGVLYSGDANQLIAPVGIVTFSGSDDAKTATDVPGGAGTEAGALRVTLPTDGTGKVNAAQTGTWTVQPGNTANTTAWKVDGSAVTQPISGSTSRVTGSVTVQQATGSNLHAVVDSGTIGTVSTVSSVTAIANALPAGANVIGHVITDATSKTQIVDGSGNVIGATSNALDVNIKSGAGSGGTALSDEAAFTQGTTQITPIGGLFKSASYRR